MKITKFVHSCLLVESSRQAILIDPGNFSWDSHLLVINKLPRLSCIVITHAHADHYHQPALQALSRKFPRAVVVTNNDLAAELQKLKLPNEIVSGSEEKLTVFEAKHEPLPLNLPKVLNIGVHIDDKLTHPGDSFVFSRSCQVLAMPLTGPFGSLRESLKSVVKLKPKVVLPVHDWEWHKAAREARYKMCHQLLKPHGIEFRPLENGVSVEI